MRPASGERTASSGTARRVGLTTLLAVSLGASAVGWMGLLMKSPLPVWGVLLSGPGLVAAGWAAVLLLPQARRHVSVLLMAIASGWVGIVTVALTIIALRLR